MNLNFKSLGLAITVNPEDESSVKMLIEQVEAKCAALTTQVQTAKGELDKFKAALGDANITEEQAKKIAADAKAYAEQAVEETVKFGAACGMIAKEKVDERRAELKAMPVEQVKVWLETYQKIWNDRNGASGKLADPDSEGKPDEKAVKVNVPASDY
jgi:regulator of protease activity HflC (stomatin/prohibitin superfamily)